MLFWEWEWVSSLSLKVRCAYKQTWTDVHCQVVERKSTSQLLGQLPWSQWLPFILSWQTLRREQLLLVIFYWYKALRGEKRKPRNCSQFTKQQQTSPARNSPPPDWLKATMARIVPSLQLADTVHFQKLDPVSGIPLRISILPCRLGSSALGWLVGTKSCRLEQSHFTRGKIGQVFLFLPWRLWNLNRSRAVRRFEGKDHVWCKPGM